MSHDVDDFDLEDLSDIDNESQHQEESSDSAAHDSFELHNTTPSTPSESMYTFNNPSHTPVGRSRSTTTTTTTPLNSTPVSRVQSTMNFSGDQLVDMIHRQNELILQLLNKQESISKCIDEVKMDLKETTSNVNSLLEVRKKLDESDTSAKKKRKYPSLLTVSFQ